MIPHSLVASWAGGLFHGVIPKVDKLTASMKAQQQIENRERSRKYVSLQRPADAFVDDFVASCRWRFLLALTPCSR